MSQVNPYISFNGNCEDAFNYYKKVFGGEFGYVGRYNEMPPQEGMPPMPEAEANKIMHISLPISNETILMGADTSHVFGGEATMGTNIALSINAANEDEAKRIFADLANGGRVNMPIDKTFWGALFGMCTDQFGINWMVNYDYNTEAKN